MYRKLFFVTCFLVSAITTHSARVDPRDASSKGFNNRLQLPLGNVDGLACDGHASVIRYLGIPFAEPAVGNLRFKPPLPYNRRYPSPALQATSNPPPCGSYCAKDGFFLGTDFSSEDCLFLTIWMPVDAVTSPTLRPVKVYIHGGHDMECSMSDPFIDGCEYAFKTGDIQVSMQYRKGPFGFLAHPSTFRESNTTGNWAILDQQLALKWIRDNIKYFGGDNTKIMLNGHSQGGQYVDFHQVAPGSAGLFHSAISQSPPCVRQLSLHQAYNLTRKFLEILQCSVNETNQEEELACLRKLPWKTVFEAANQLPADEGLAYAMCESLLWEPTFQAVVDGVVFPMHLVEALKSGNYNQVPYMVGFATNEGNFFIQNFDVTDSTFAKVLADTYPYADVTPVQQLYPIQYYGHLDTPEKAQVGDLWTDLFFKCPIYERLTARGSTSTTPIYLYQFDVTPTCPTGAENMGAYHSVDLMFTFGLMDIFIYPDDDCKFTPKEAMLSDVAIVAWTSMLEERVPKWKNGSSWNTWNVSSQIGTFLNIDTTSTRVIDLAYRCDVLREAKLASLQALSQPSSLSSAL